MKINVYELINKYVSWAGFDWLHIYFDKLGRLRFHDYEERRPISFNETLRWIFENGMLDECFTQEELERLFNVVPDTYKMDVYYYMEENNGRTN